MCVIFDYSKQSLYLQKIDLNDLNIYVG